MKTSTKVLILVCLAVAVMGALIMKKHNQDGTKGSVANLVGEPGLTDVIEGKQNPPNASRAMATDLSNNQGSESIDSSNQAKRLKLLSFGAGWCLPCRMMEPVREALKREYGHVLEVLHYDVNKDEAMAMKYEIRLIPTLIFMDTEGQVLGRHEGYISKEGILAKWKQFGIDVQSLATNKVPTETD